MAECVIVDIDGTIADCEHRRAHLRAERPNWAAFNASMGDDTPNPAVARLLRSLEGETIVLCTGREEDYRRLTETWLTLHGIKWDRLLMRASKDYRPDHEIKREMLAALRKEGIAPWLVIDDRTSVVKMWREEGLTCLQCAAGDF